MSSRTPQCDINIHISTIYLKEDLSRARSLLSFDARKLRRDGKIADTWVFDGRIKIKTLNNLVVNINKKQDLDQNIQNCTSRSVIPCLFVAILYCDKDTLSNSIIFNFDMQLQYWVIYQPISMYPMHTFCCFILFCLFCTLVDIHIA